MKSLRPKQKISLRGKPFTEEGEDSSIFADAKKKIAALQEQEAISEEEASELEDAVVAALVNDFKPAYEALASYLEADLENTAETTLGIGAYPNGKAYYNFLLKQNTTTDLTADEIHEIGLSEVARLRKDFEAIQKEVGFDGSLSEFFEQIRKEKDNRDTYFENSDEGREAYIEEATAAIENIKASLPDYFGLMPKADIVVKRDM